MDAGRYRILEAIGRGGMAEVYRAVAVGPAGFEKEVVVKRILPRLAKDPDLARMIVDEAKIASRLDHPNVVQIYDLGSIDGEFFLVMELVRGLDLARVQRALDLRAERVPAPVALRIVAEVCRALDYAHRQVDGSGRPLSIVHRDVSPQNVLLSSEGAVKLGDFGIARATGIGGDTEAGLLKGKIAYVAPEQVADAEIDGRTDVYAAGIVLYELLTGRHPFATSSDAETLRRARAPEIEAPSRVDPSIDPALDAIVMRALAPVAANRHATAGELHLAIEAYLRDGRIAVTATDVAALVRQATLGQDATEPLVVLDGVFADEIERLGADETGLSRFTRTRDLAGSFRPLTTPAIPKPAGRPPVWRWAVLPAALVALGSIALLASRAGGLGPPAGGRAPVSEPRRVEERPLSPRVEVVPAVRRALELPLPEADAGRARPLSEPRKIRRPVVEDPEPERPPPPLPPAEPGTLRIGSAPHWARITIDGVVRGTTPLSVSLPAGTYTVHASNPELGRSDARRVVVASGRTQSVVFDPF